MPELNINIYNAFVFFSFFFVAVDFDVVYEIRLLAQCLSHVNSESERKIETKIREKYEIIFHSSSFDR